MKNSYSYPNGTLINKKGILDSWKLMAYEYTRAERRNVELTKSPIKGDFDLPHLQKIHHHLFQDVYEWAGNIRSVDMGKGKTWFYPKEYIPEHMKILHQSIMKSNNLKGLENRTFVEQLAETFTYLNAIHPFREGNGRSTRVFFEQLANEAGYRLDFSKVERLEWNKASEDCFFGNIEPLKKVFDKVVHPDRPVAYSI